jgi:hypothetical protein
MKRKDDAMLEKVRALSGGTWLAPKAEGRRGRVHVNPTPAAARDIKATCRRPLPAGGAHPGHPLPHAQPDPDRGAAAAGAGSEGGGQAGQADGREGKQGQEEGAWAEARQTQCTVLLG